MTPRTTPGRGGAGGDSRGGTATPQLAPGPSGPPCPLLARVRGAASPARVAVADAGGSWSYGELAAAAESTARRFREAAGGLAGERVACLAPPGRRHVAALLAAWTEGATAVPLASSHPLPELTRVLDDAAPRLVLADPSLRQAAALLQAAEDRGAATLLLADDNGAPGRAEEPGRPTVSRKAARANPASAGPADGALLVYTSGTTGRPKGALLTHRALTAQMRSLVQAWAWTSEDRILHVLPLHHVHGLVNALCCALWSGAACEFASARPAADVWKRWADGGVTVFMAVPTIYARLAGEWERAPERVRRSWSRGAAALRLMVSGSAALPVSVFQRWRAASGHDLLERYGMTETGMTLSNPLAGPRRPGHVGQALPRVEVRLVGEDGAVVPEGRAGEIQVRGPTVFSQYWRRPQETEGAFVEDWFRTGDLARVDDGAYRILGRRGTDIFKTGGYRVSALEVEEAYRTHPGVGDIAVSGVADPEWGDRLCAAYVPENSADREDLEGRDDPEGSERPEGSEGLGGAGSPGSPVKATPDALRAWGKERLAPYKVPRAFVPVRQLPRTTMGKVRRAEVARLFGPRDDRARRSSTEPRAPRCCTCTGRSSPRDDQAHRRSAEPGGPGPRPEDAAGLRRPGAAIPEPGGPRSPPTPRRGTGSP